MAPINGLAVRRRSDRRRLVCVSRKYISDGYEGVKKFRSASIQAGASWPQFYTRLLVNGGLWGHWVTAETRLRVLP